MPWLDPRIPGFVDGKALPEEYLDRSPPIAWNDPGTNVQSYAIVLEDVGVTPPRIHWCVFDLPEPLRGVPGDLGTALEVAGGKQATNDLGVVGYTSPESSSKATGQFRLRIYALTTKLGFEPGTPARVIAAATSGKVSQVANRIVARGPVRSVTRRVPDLARA